MISSKIDQKIEPSLAEELHTLLNPTATSELTVDNFSLNAEDESSSEAKDELTAERLSQILDLIKRINSEAQNAPAILDTKNEEGLTPLAVAIYKKYTDIAKKLIESKADINFKLQNENANNLLMYACSKGYVEIVSTLIEAKADLTVKTKQGSNALHVALKSTKNSGYQDEIDASIKLQIPIAIKLIDAKADLVSFDENKNTPLIIATEMPHDVSEIALRLVAEGVDLNFQNGDGDTALMWAARRGRTVLVKKLIESGAKVNLTNHKTESALEGQYFAYIDTDNEHRLDHDTHEFYWQHTSIYFSIKAMLIKSGALIRNFKKLYDDIQSADPNNPDTLLCLKALLEQHNRHSSDEYNPLLLPENELVKANVYLKQLMMLSDFYNKDVLDAKTDFNLDKMDLNLHGEHDRTALMHACRTHNLSAVTKLIKAKANVNARDKFDATALMYAVRKGDQATVMLIEAKANLNLQDETGRTALIRAIEYHNLAAFTRLIDAKADVNIRDYKKVNRLIYTDFDPPIGRNALFVAVIENQVEIIKKMDVNTRTTTDDTALMLAANVGNAESIQVLIEAQANCDIQNEKGMTALMYAAKRRHLACLTKLIDAKADLNVENYDYKNALELALQGEPEDRHQPVMWEICLKLLDAGIKMNKYSHALLEVIGDAADVLEVEQSHVAVAKKLIASGIDLNFNCSRIHYDATSAFETVIRHGNKVGNVNMTLAASLVEHKASIGNPKIINHDLAKFLMVDADPNNYRDMMILLKEFNKYYECKGNDQNLSGDQYLEKLSALSDFYNQERAEGKFDLNIKNQAGCTPLMFAAKENNVALLAKMISAKANVNLVDDEQKSALYYAIENNHQESAVTLIEAKANIYLKMKNGGSFLHRVCDKAHKKIALKLIEYKADLDTINSDGFTPLAALCAGDDKYSYHSKKPESYFHRNEIAKWLIEAKADINVSLSLKEKPAIPRPSFRSRSSEDESKKNVRTVLHVAVEHSRVQIVTQLIAAGVDVNRQDENGRTALFIAFEKQDMVCAVKLIKAGTDVNQKDKHGMTVLDQLSRAYEGSRYDGIDKYYMKLAERISASREDLRNSEIVLGLKKLCSQPNRMMEATEACSQRNRMMGAAESCSQPNSMMEAKESPSPSMETKLQPPEEIRDINVQDSSGQTLLMRYLNDRIIPFQNNSGEENERKRMVMKLISAKADLNIQDNEGKTALMYAPHADLVAKLISAKANIDIQDNAGNTALHLNTKYELILETLIEAKASLQIKNKEGENVLLLMCHQFATDYSASLALLTKVINLRTDLNVQDNLGNTPHMKMVGRYENIAAINKLIEAKSDLDRQNNQGETVLMLACQQANLTTVEKLIEAKANLNLRNHENLSALMLMLKNDFVYYHANSNNFETLAEQVIIAKRLIEAGADFEFTQSIEDKDSPEKTQSKVQSALDLAISFKVAPQKLGCLRLPLVSLLLCKKAKIHNLMELYQFLKLRDQREPAVLSCLAILCHQLEVTDKGQTSKLSEDQFKEIQDYFKKLTHLTQSYHTEIAQLVEAAVAESHIPKSIGMIIGSYSVSLKNRICFFSEPKHIERLSNGARVDDLSLNESLYESLNESSVDELNTEPALDDSLAQSTVNGALTALGVDAHKEPSQSSCCIIC